MRKIYYGLLGFIGGFYRFLIKNRLRVLVYHDVPDQKKFQNHIKYLSSTYSIISVDELITSIEGKAELPEYPLLLTFDDGYMSVFENGFPVLKQYKIPAVIFVVTDYLNKEKDFWWRNIMNNEKQKGNSEADGRAIINRMKKITNKQRLSYIERLPESKASQLNSKELKTLKNNHIFIGNHSHTHAYFDKCSPEEMEGELSKAKLVFKENDLEGYHVFAYPNGNATKVSEKVLKNNDIKLAFLFDHRINSKTIDPLNISRISTNADMPLSELKAKVSGIHSLIYQK